MSLATLRTAVRETIRLGSEIDQPRETDVEARLTPAERAALHEWRHKLETVAHDIEQLPPPSGTRVWI